MNLTDIFLEKGQCSKSGIYFIESGSKETFLSYAELKTQALRALYALQELGMQPGNELVLQVEDNKSFIIIFWACILGGIIPVPLTAGRNDDNRKKLFQVWSLLNNPSLAVLPGQLEQLQQFGDKEGWETQVAAMVSRAHAIEDILHAAAEGKVHQPQDGDIAFIQFSSGSTGSPKGVVLTHENLMANIDGISRGAAYSEKDSMLSWMPLSHDMGMIGFHLNPLILGMDQYLMSTSLFIRNPRLWFDKIAEHGVSITCSPNFGYRYFLRNLKEDQYKWDLSRVRIIYNGAEPISEALCLEFNGKMSQFGLKENAMCPVYGLAEASVAVCMSDHEATVQAVYLNRHQLNPGNRVEETAVPDERMAIVNVGKAIAHCAVKITDADGKDLDEDIVGHIRIKGTNVTRGYYNRPELFTQLVDAHGWMDTGDLGFIRDGALFVTGRAKDIIFVNGQNYYSHDIEKEAEAVAGVELNKFVVCGAFNTGKQTEEVVGFLLHRGTLESMLPVLSAIRQFVNGKFGFEIDKIIPVKEIPKTTSGKLKRYELMNRYRTGEFEAVILALQELIDINNSEAVEAPCTGAESDLLRIWQEVFQRSDFGVTQRFFEIGGNSLLAAGLIMKIQQVLQVVLPFDCLYEWQTIRKIAGEMGQLRKSGFEPIPAAAIAAPVVSSSQRRLYYAWKVDPDSVAYNIPLAIKLPGELQPERLSECLQYLVDRHDAFSMNFFMEEEPRIKTSGHYPAALAIVNSEGDIDETLRSLIQPFDLANGPLFRFALINNKFLFLDFHHIISDGRSVSLFVQELFQLYSGASLPALPATFGDFVAWKRQEEIATGTKEYWKDQFADDIPVLALPYDFQRPAVQDNKGKRWRFGLDQEMTDRLKVICKARGISAHAFLFTAYQVLLAKYSGQEDLVVGIPSHGRIHPDIQAVQGMFVNNLPIRSAMSGDDTFAGLLHRNFKLVRQAIDHQGWPFNELVEALQLPVNPGRNPLFDTMFLYQDWQDVAWQPYRFDPGFSKFDITLEVVEEADTFSFELEYATSLFTADTIVGMAQGLANIIQRVIENPDIKIALLSPLADQGIADVPLSGKTYHSVMALFEAQVARNPEQIAIVWEEQQISFGELTARVDVVACALRRMGIGKPNLVGIHMKRSPELVIAILGVLRAGAAYLPLEYDTPAERVRFILEDSRCDLLINDLNMFSEGGKMPLDACEPGDLAYVIYTSGSTGAPKGVMINHDSLFNYISWAAEMYTDDAPCTFALYSSISFDLTVTSIFTPLITGNKMVIYGEDDTDVAIGNVVKHNVADIVKLTPAHLRLLVGNGLLSAATRIKRFIVGGEAFDSGLARDVHELTNGQTVMFNEYGPTEATVGCMIYRFNTDDCSNTVPIGIPVSDTQIYILDRYLMPVPMQVTGEIYIAGRGLARGYLYRDELTADRFIVHEGVRMYKTGDLAKMLPDGNIVYLGRNDNQVKISGNRVELSEIEARLGGFEGIEAAVVLPDSRNANGLIAYIVTGHSFSDSELPDYLAKVLPYFMIPKRFIPVAAIPLTKNGKIDTAKLRALEATSASPRMKVAESDVEKIFVAIWEDVLHTTGAGITDNFFEHGGDSIKAVQMSSRLFEQGISVKVRDILTYHTIAQISRHAVFAEPAGDTGLVSGEIVPAPVQSWFFSHQFKRPECYTQSVLLKVNETPDRRRLKEALNTLIAHHDALRINYDREKKVLFYNNEHLKTDVAIPEFVIDAGQSITAVCNNIRYSFDLAKGLLFKACLLKVHDGTTLLFLTAHHLIVDGISWQILLQDLYNVYTATYEVLPPRTASYSNWSRLHTADEFEAERGYWAEMEQSDFSIASDVRISDYSMKNTGTVVVSLDAAVTAYLLTEAHTSYNTDVLILLNAAMVLTLQSRTGYDEFVIEQENHGRGYGTLNISRTVGWFTAIYPLKFTYQDEIGALIKSVKETLRSVPNRGIGYGVNTFLSGKAPSVYFQEVRMNYLGEFGHSFNNPLLSLHALNAGNESHPDNVFTALLECNAWVNNGQFTASMTGNLDAFSDNTLDDFAGTFMKNLTMLLQHLKDEDRIHFTPSDFPSADLQEEEIHDLFND